MDERRVNMKLKTEEGVGVDGVRRVPSDTSDRRYDREFIPFDGIGVPETWTRRTTNLTRRRVYG